MSSPQGNGYLTPTLLSEALPDEVGDVQTATGLRPAHSLRVFRQDVDFDVERISGTEGMQVGGLVSVRNDGNFYPTALDRGHGQADAFDRNRPLRHNILRERRGDLNLHTPVFPALDFVEPRQLADSIHVSLYHMAANPVLGASGEL